jgi:O-acetyl-ADP-ribose deacetylase (regulator of RNase III)
MIELITGDILKADVEALVNTVNTQGMMGKGIALQFRKAYPEMFADYQSACKAGNVRVGKMHVYDMGQLFNPRYIVNFPTKTNWRLPSRLEYIEKGLRSLVEEIRSRRIKSIAIPPLGSGLGGLKWSQVLSRIQRALDDLEDVRVLVFQPAYTPDSALIVNRSLRPKMNHSRATVLQLLSRYCVLGYELTLLEVQKLLYFLQEAGEPLKLRFDKGAYGPYADNVRHILDRFEGHFTSGFEIAENRPSTPVHIYKEAALEAKRYLEENPDPMSLSRLDRVARLIEGFESPYGMELLASVHWVACNDAAIRNSSDAEGITRAVRMWNTRKKRLMKPEHIQVAWERLVRDKWLES